MNSALRTLLRRDALDGRAGRFRGTKRHDQVGFLRLRDLEMALLDVAVAADLFGNAGELDRERVVVRREPRQQLLDQRLVAVMSWRSSFRSAVLPKTSSAVPRRPFSFASTRNALIIHGP